MPILRHRELGFMARLTDSRVLITLENYSIEMRALGPSSSTERDLTWLGLSELADLSSDGRRVLFTLHPEGAGEGGQTYIRQTDGTPGVRLGDGLALALSPDGKWALSQLTSPSRLMLLPTGIGTAKALKGAGLAYWRWGSSFADSRRVVFMAQANNGPPRAYVQDTEGGDPLPIGPPGVRFPIVAPDGRTVAAFTQGGPVLFTIGASDARPCPGLDAEDVPIAWSPDGSHIASVSSDGSAQIWSAKTWKRVRTFQSGNSSKRSVAWSSDSERLSGTLGADSMMCPLKKRRRSIEV
jgi:WD40 repeat protein